MLLFTALMQCIIQIGTDNKTNQIQDSKQIKIDFISSFVKGTQQLYIHKLQGLKGHIGLNRVCSLNGL